MTGKAYKALNPIAQRFLDELVQGKTGKEAMQAVRPAFKRPDVAAAKLLARDDVQQALDELNADIGRRAGIDPVAVLREIGAVAFADIRDLYDDAGELRPIHTLDRRVAAQIAGVDVEELTSDGVSIGRLRKVRRHDKLRALEILAKHPAVFPNIGDGEAGDVFNIQINIGTPP